MAYHSSRLRWIHYQLKVSGDDWKGQPCLRRSPQCPVHLQPLIWIVCAIWIVKRPSDRLMHNSKEHAEQAAYFGVNSLYFPAQVAAPLLHHFTQSPQMLQMWYMWGPGKWPWSALHSVVLKALDRRVWRFILYLDLFEEDCEISLHALCLLYGSRWFWSVSLVEAIF